MNYALAYIGPGSGTDSDATLTRLEDLTTEDYERYKTAYSALWNARRESLIDHVDESLTVAEMQVDALAKDILNHKVSATFHQLEISRRVTTFALSVLEAFYVFDQHTKARAAKMRDGSLAAVQQVFTDAYEAPWLNLMILMRGACVHQSVKPISWHSGVYEVKDSRNVSHFCITVDREALYGLYTRAGDKFDPDVREYLDGFKAGPDLLHVAREAFFELEEVAPDLAQLLEKPLLPHAETLDELDERFGPEHQNRLLFVMNDDGTPVVDGQVIVTPLHPDGFAYARQLLGNS